MKKQNKSTIEHEKLLKMDDVMEILGFKRSFIVKAKDQLGLPFYKIGGAVRFKLSEINQWVDERRVI